MLLIVSLALAVIAVLYYRHDAQQYEMLARSLNEEKQEAHQLLFKAVEATEELLRPTPGIKGSRAYAESVIAEIEALLSAQESDNQTVFKLSDEGELDHE